MEKLKGKRALVTGASRGIGKAIALRLAADGAKVAINFNNNQKLAEIAAEEIYQAGGESLIVKANVSQSSEVDSMFEHILTTWDGIDILVNNAGVTKDALVIRMSEEDWDEVISTNLKGAFLCVKGAIQHMLRQRWGRIINISSIVGVAGNPGQANYAASKAGLIALTRTIAREVGSRNITANAVTPGFITTDMVTSLSDQTIETIKQNIPLGRLGTPQDVAGLVAFLASDEAGYITGQAIGIDGAMAI